MTLLNHWHPTIKSNQLKRKPVLFQLCNEEIVLFRSAKGEIGALKKSVPSPWNAAQPRVGGK